MTPNLKIGKAIINILNDIEDVPAFVIAAPPGTKYPFIVYRRTGISPVSSKDVLVGLTVASVEVSVVTDSYEQSLNIAQDVVNAIQSKRGTSGDVYIAEVTVDSASEELNTDAFVQNISFTIKYS